MTTTNDDILDDATRAATSIDPLQLNDEFAKFPATLAHWNARLALATENYLEADLAFDKTEASLFIEMRETLADESELDKKVKVTEASVKERVTVDQRYIDARTARIEAEVEQARVKGVVTALLAKRDMLISLGASVRAEMEGSPSVRSQHRHAHGND